MATPQAADALPSMHDDVLSRRENARPGSKGIGSVISMQKFVQNPIYPDRRWMPDYPDGTESPLAYGNDKYRYDPGAPRTKYGYSYDPMYPAWLLRMLGARKDFNLPPVRVPTGEQLLKSPARKHYMSINRPNKADTWDHTFRGGVPDAVILSFAHWLRACIPVEQARRDWMQCYFERYLEHPAYCIEPAADYVEKVGQAAELPFQQCPRESVALIRCVDYNRANFAVCRERQRVWETCMESKFPEMQFPPKPEHPEYRRSYQQSNLPHFAMYQ
eukprot:NODE_2486_length_1054_cov_66.690399_g2468_i0.p1 GENE.NODE_2486_length_1054_cov_66.690399_g2468_i0~~NODE_2486_length_1054_cov_66.690399_g2468_i0.p1  ORF type:complete len:274 (+),score=31.63 NODE_2486_length_1054_cov_66.690399_g2468_i0:64-885(+)